MSKSETVESSAETALQTPMGGIAGELAAILSVDELVAITGGYRQPSSQLAELHRQGFYRARKSNLTGKVVLEREHYLAVCRGLTLKELGDCGPRPKVRPL